MHSKIEYLTFAVVTIFMVGCSTVPLEPKEASQNAKQFTPPPAGKAGIYVYRDSVFGGALKKDIWIDNKCLGESAPKVFFYQDVKGNKMHIISTESEFSPNQLVINTKAGKNYFIRQYIKMGAFVGGADLEQINEDEAKKAISELDMAKKGTCSKLTAK
ncbi:DUF2846 domain-containing protein [Sulfurimonas sp. NW15]|uniref:DUF2846 domain-containing protein n=1 Tax=Sulfurimonas sp. NW15 TaxID=2922729 RepID=UPI003DAA0315